ncbi:hypothetical protein NG798_15445 [Ancylothrix sp. C2]|uniref:hypothetical protein n=1 Tax=Ancylothrix sp. D3o TaxID=2953691 RepID=UPI0021BA48A6|nr:hypothetical protein [Ancylothrix sp. D3o]MCT7951194.1 hypothetical protein [Ancylothrix sp. D3o]
MNSHQARIHTLIAEIDSVLQMPVPRLPWMGETVKDYRRVLERTRSYLGEIQPLLGEPQQSANIIQAEESGNSPQAVEQMLQNVIAEMTGLRSNLMQPLQNDLETLQKERDSLLKEIRQLERQHSIYSTEQANQQQQLIAEFLQILSSRLQETLSQQISQSLSKIEDQLLSGGAQSLEGEITPELPGIWEPSALYGQPSAAPLHPQQRLANLLHLQRQTDQLLVSLDTTLSVVFEALLRNVHGYEESLSKGLDKMYSLGQQGEIMFTHLVNHLAQTLGQEAAGLLQNSITKGNLEPTSQPSQTETEKTIAPAKTNTTAAKKKPKPSDQTQAKAPTTTNSQKQPSQNIQEPKTQTSPTEGDNTSIALPIIDDLQELLSALELSTPEPAQEPEQENTWLDLFNTTETNQTAPIETASNQIAETGSLTEPQLESLYAELFGLTEPVEINTEPAKQNISETESIGIDLFEEALFGKQTEPDQTNSQPEPEDFLFFEQQTTNTNPLNPETVSSENDSLDIFNELFPEEQVSLEATGTTDFSTPSDEEPQTITEEPDPLVLADEWTADNFIPASPEENLLPASEELNTSAQTPNRPGSSFALENPNLLEQLQDDLSLLATDTPSLPPQTTENFDSPNEWTSLGPLTTDSSDEDNPTFGEWVSDMGLSSTPAPSSNLLEPATEMDDTLEEEPLLTSMEEWLTQLTQTQLSNVAAPSSNPEPGPVIKETPNMTLDEAFASLGAATASSTFSQPETLETADLFESENLTPPPGPASNPEPQSLDDLFATLNDSPPSSEENVRDLFASDPTWDTTGTTSKASLDDLGNLSLDDFFASLEDDSQSGNAGSNDDDLFSFGAQFSDSSDSSQSGKKKP